MAYGPENNPAPAMMAACLTGAPTTTRMRKSELQQQARSGRSPMSAAALEKRLAVHALRNSLCFGFRRKIGRSPSLVRKRSSSTTMRSTGLKSAKTARDRHQLIMNMVS